VGDNETHHNSMPLRWVSLRSTHPTVPCAATRPHEIVKELRSITPDTTLHLTRYFGRMLSPSWIASCLRFARGRATSFGCNWAGGFAAPGGLWIIFSTML